MHTNQGIGLELHIPGLDLHGSNVDIDINLPNRGLNLHGPSAVDIHAKPPHIEPKVTGSAPGAPS